MLLTRLRQDIQIILMVSTPLYQSEFCVTIGASAGITMNVLIPQFRAQFPALQDAGVYLDSAATAPNLKPWLKLPDSFIA